MTALVASVSQKHSASSHVPDVSGRFGEFGRRFVPETLMQALECTQARVRTQLVKNIAGLKSLIKFAPYAAGDTFSQADCAAFASLPLIGMASKAIYGEDLLLSGGVDYKAYIKMIGERPSAQKVLADRKAATAPAATKPA